MKKLLLTLGTVAAVAAPVASVVACGESTTATTPEFQELSIAGITFKADAQTYVSTDLKGAVYVKVGSKEYVIPGGDIKLTKDKDGKVTGGTIVAGSTTKTTIAGNVTDVKVGKLVIFATKVEADKIEAGKVGEVKTIDAADETKTKDFLTGITKASTLKTALGAKDVDGVVDTFAKAPKITEQEFAEKSFFNSYFGK